MVGCTAVTTLAIFRPAHNEDNQREFEQCLTPKETSEPPIGFQSLVVINQRVSKHFALKSLLPSDHPDLFLNLTASFISDFS